MEDPIWNAIEAGAPKFSGDMTTFVKGTQQYWRCAAEDYCRIQTRGVSEPAKVALEILQHIHTDFINCASYEDIGNIIRKLTWVTCVLENPVHQMEALDV